MKQSTSCKTWGVVDMETTNKHAKTQKYTRDLARRSQLFFQLGPYGISQLLGVYHELRIRCGVRFSGSLCTQHYHITCLNAQTKMLPGRYFGTILSYRVPEQRFQRRIKRHPRHRTWPFWQLNMSAVRCSLFTSSTTSPPPRSVP